MSLLLVKQVRLVVHVSLGFLPRQLQVNSKPNRTVRPIQQRHRPYHRPRAYPYPIRPLPRSSMMPLLLTNEPSNNANSLFNISSRQRAIISKVLRIFEPSIALTASRPFWLIQINRPIKIRRLRTDTAIISHHRLLPIITPARRLLHV